MTLLSNTTLQPLLTPEQRAAERGGYTDTLNRLHAAEARVSVLETELRVAQEQAAAIPWDAINDLCLRTQTVADMLPPYNSDINIIARWLNANAGGRQ